MSLLEMKLVFFRIAKLLRIFGVVTMAINNMVEFLRSEPMDFYYVYWFLFEFSTGRKKVTDPKANK